MQKVNIARFSIYSIARSKKPSLVAAHQSFDIETPDNQQQVVSNMTSQHSTRLHRRGIAQRIPRKNFQKLSNESDNFEHFRKSHDLRTHVGQ